MIDMVELTVEGRGKTYSLRFIMLLYKSQCVCYGWCRSVFVGVFVCVCVCVCVWVCVCLCLCVCVCVCVCDWKTCLFCVMCLFIIVQVMLTCM